ncbi:Verru_Chthon cassette protein D [Verrucomicrobium sp. BvORR106]|uniref:Verru_Chthon cassette protein D n=1 Tax=Verrucomicrobium sp. BvORR106 TaxID=1403819 RepID=UPI0005701D01|nr:Verru_Chthon cassette protein D [Verrucomicrobium sp. BvORR106]
MNSPRTIRLNHPARGFTLIEIMVVMALIGVLMALSLNVSSAWKAQKLTAQARGVASECSQAVLMAQKDNFPVEIRFYQMPDDLGGGSATAFRAFQLVRLTGYNPTDGKAIYKNLTEVKYFEDDIILHETAEYTSIKNLPVQSPPEDAIPLRGAVRNYVSFMFLPNGTTTLTRTPDAVFTFVKENEMKTPDALPDNYRSMVLQPVTGHTTVY